MLAEAERDLLLHAVVDTVVPKLVADDIPLLRSLLTDVFPGANMPRFADELLERTMQQVRTHTHTHPLFLPTHTKR